jgi:hypothetical protein
MGDVSGVIVEKPSEGLGVEKADGFRGNIDRHERQTNRSSS